MSAPQYPYPAPPPPPAPESSLKTALAAGAIVASLGFNCFLLYQLNDLRADSAKNRELIQSEIETLKENSTAMTATQRKHLDDLKEELDQRSRQLNQAASQAKKEALSYADQQAQRLEAENRQTNEVVKESVNKVNSDIAGVRQSAESANAKIADVNNDVGVVKSDLASTKTDLDKTKLDLRAVRGDLSSTSSLVATNGKEIEDLIKRGERNIIRFDVSKKTKGYQKVGDISLLLKNADPKKNRFTLEVQADDKLVEKKDRNINEPLQFYVSKSLYELVVNTVGKDTISGYLSTPKYQGRNN